MVMEDFFMNGDANIQKRGKKMLGISFLPAPSFLPLGSFPHSPTLSPWWPPVCLRSLHLLILGVPDKWDHTHVVIFCIWLISVSIMFARLVHNVACTVISPHPNIPSSPVQFSSVTQSCLTLCDPMNCSTPGLSVHHQLPESTQTPVH